MNIYVSPHAIHIVAWLITVSGVAAIGRFLLPPADEALLGTGLFIFLLGVVKERVDRMNRPETTGRGSNGRFRRRTRSRRRGS
jgi:hypothetical protein